MKVTNTPTNISVSQLYLSISSFLSMRFKVGYDLASLSRTLSES